MKFLLILLIMISFIGTSFSIINYNEEKCEKMETKKNLFKQEFVKDFNQQNKIYTVNGETVNLRELELENQLEQIERESGILFKCNNKYITQFKTLF